MYSAIIVAGGKGERTGLSYNKIWYEVNGKALIHYVIESFKRDLECEEIIVAAHADDLDRMKKAFAGSVDKIIQGGSYRQESVYKGAQAAKAAHVVIHDGSRPYLPIEVLKRVKQALLIHSAVTCAMPVVDTLKQVRQARIVEDIDRDDLVAIQTPQGFERDLLLRAHETALKEEGLYTCDASLVKQVLNIDVFVVKGDRKNIKFTTIEDCELLEAVLA